MQLIHNSHLPFLVGTVKALPAGHHVYRQNRIAKMGNEGNRHNSPSEIGQSVVPVLQVAEIYT